MKIDLLSVAVLAKLRSSASLETEEDAAQLIADAINTYVELGQRARSGAQYFVKSGPDAPLQRLRLPFEAASTATRTSGHEG